MAAEAGGLGGQVTQGSAFARPPLLPRQALSTITFVSTGVLA